MIIMVDKDKINTQLNKLKMLGYTIYGYNNWAIVFGKGSICRYLNIQNGKISNTEYNGYSIQGDFLWFEGVDEKGLIITYMYLPNTKNLLSRNKGQFTAIYSSDNRIAFLVDTNLKYYKAINNNGKIQKLTPSYMPFNPYDIVIDRNIDGTYLVSECRLGYNHGDTKTVKDELLLIDFNLNLIKDYRR